MIFCTYVTVKFSKATIIRTLKISIRTNTQDDLKQTEQTLRDGSTYCNKYFCIGNEDLTLFIHSKIQGLSLESEFGILFFFIFNNNEDIVTVFEKE